MKSPKLALCGEGGKGVGIGKCSRVKVGLSILEKVLFERFITTPLW